MNKLDKKLKKIFKEFNPESVKSTQEVGKKSRAAILEANFYEPIYQQQYNQFSDYYGFKVHQSKPDINKNQS